MPVRQLAEGMGEAVFSRVIQRKNREGKGETWEDVGIRVAKGNSLLHSSGAEDEVFIRDQIHKAAFLASGRHLQHGDATQPTRAMNVYSNCSTSALTSVAFLLLLEGSGVGRSYDDDVVIVDWTDMPEIEMLLDTSHPDYAAIEALEIEHYPGLMRDKDPGEYYDADEERESAVFYVDDSREGWAKAVEYMECAAYRGDERKIIFDFSNVRPKGSPIRGMQDRQATGPDAMIIAFHKVRGVVKQARHEHWPAWKTALFVDHFLAECVVSGGARRSARIATKHWQDEDILDFISVKHKYLDAYGYPILWSANNSVAVDQDFYDRIAEGDIKALSIAQAITQAQYTHGTGEPGVVNIHRLHQDKESFRQAVAQYGGDYVGYSAFSLTRTSKKIIEKIQASLLKKEHFMIVNPCSEIVLNALSGFCVIGDVCPYFCDTLDEVEETFKMATRFLMRVNLMPSVFEKEVKRTNRIGVGMTGLQEFAWKFFHLTFRDMLSESPAAQAFWKFLRRMSNVVGEEAKRYAKVLGVEVPHTWMTMKPAGTNSKLFGVSEGGHRPRKRRYKRNVQFNTFMDRDRIEQLRAAGYPVRQISSPPNTVIVGFPTEPEICKIMPSELIVTAPEASFEEEIEYLKRLEENFIDGDHQRGNQISYTVKFDPKKVGYSEYHDLFWKLMGTVKACSVLPLEDESKYEYLPEEDVSDAEYDEMVSHITRVKEEIDLEALKCDNGICPI